MAIKPIDNENELLCRIAEGDEKAFALIFYGYYQQLGDYIEMMTDSKEMAQEIVQDIFIKLWESRASLPELKSFSSWLFIITRNKTLDAIRKNVRENRYKESLSRQEATTEEDEAAIYDRHDFSPVIQKAVQQLPPQQKRVFELKQSGRKNADIAIEMQISAESVRKYQQWALKSISAFVKANAELTLILLIIESLKK